MTATSTIYYGEIVYALVGNQWVTAVDPSYPGCRSGNNLGLFLGPTPTPLVFLSPQSTIPSDAQGNPLPVAYGDQVMIRNQITGYPWMADSSFGKNLLGADPSLERGRRGADPSFGTGRRGSSKTACVYGQGNLTAIIFSLEAVYADPAGMSIPAWTLDEASTVTTQANAIYMAANVGGTLITSGGGVGLSSSSRVAVEFFLETPAPTPVPLGPPLPTPLGPPCPSPLGPPLPTPLGPPLPTPLGPPCPTPLGPPLPTPLGPPLPTPLGPPLPTPLGPPLPSPLGPPLPTPLVPPPFVPPPPPVIPPLVPVPTPINPPDPNPCPSPKPHPHPKPKPHPHPHHHHHHHPKPKPPKPGPSTTRRDAGLLLAVILVGGAGYAYYRGSSRYAAIAGVLGVAALGIAIY